MLDGIDVSALSRRELRNRIDLSGYQDTRADALSGGQLQRVGISRALMQKPDLLLVNEPTASLNLKTSRQIMRLLVELAHKRGTWLASPMSAASASCSTPQ